MTDREKLIALIQAAVNGCSSYWAGLIADQLLANGVVVREWIPVTERLPKEQGYYLVAHQRSRCVAERFYYRDCPDLFVKVAGDPVTHWMPLPEPPKEGE